MDITFNSEAIDGMLEVGVNFYEYIEDKGNSIDVAIWVPDNDSRLEIKRLARVAALKQLKRAVAVLEDEILNL
ncbi:hypothetical protein ACVBIO_21320 [Shewanella sp. 0m-8]